MTSFSCFRRHPFSPLRLIRRQTHSLSHSKHTVDASNLWQARSNVFSNRNQIWGNNKNRSKIKKRDTAAQRYSSDISVWQIPEPSPEGNLFVKGILNWTESMSAHFDYLTWKCDFEDKALPIMAKWTGIKVKLSADCMSVKVLSHPGHYSQVKSSWVKLGFVNLHCVKLG